MVGSKSSSSSSSSSSLSLSDSVSLFGTVSGACSRRLHTSTFGALSSAHGTVRLPTRSCDITICDFNRLDGSSDSGCRRRCVLTKCDQKLRLWIRHLDYSSGLDIWIRHLDWTCGLDIWFRGQPPCEVKQEVAMPGVRCQGRETSPDDDANSIPFHLRLTFKVVCANKVNSFDWDFLTTRHAKRSSCSSVHAVVFMQ